VKVGNELVCVRIPLWAFIVKVMKILDP